MNEYYIIILLIIFLIASLVKNIQLSKENQSLYEEIEEMRGKVSKLDNINNKFLSNTSHEVRIPLNGIIGMTEMLELTELNKLQLSYLNIIKDSSKALFQIVNDMLDMSKIDSGKVEVKIEKTNRDSLVDEIIGNYILTAHKKGLEFITYIEPGIPEYIFTDREKIKKICTAFLSNSIKYTDSGEIFFKISKIYKDEENIKLKFSVLDTGIGIELEEKKDMFSALDIKKERKTMSSGLGLSIAQKLVNILGGEIGLESIKDKGSEFYFIIDVKIDDTSKENILPQINKKVLLFEKNNTTCDVISKILSEISVETVRTYDYKDILNILDEKNDFDFFILNYQLKEIEFGNILKKIKSKEKIITMLTSIDSKNIFTKLSSYGIKKYLIKPFKKMELHNMLLERDNIFEKKEGDKNLREKLLEKLKILVVEDNNINQKTTKIMLEKFGYITDVASDGKEAIEKINEKKYDIVLMDIQMPVINGFEATKIIRRTNKDIIIIALTAYALKGDKEKCIESGMNDYLSKPYRKQQLYDIIKKYI